MHVSHRTAFVFILLLSSIAGAQEVTLKDERVIRPLVGPDGVILAKEKAARILPDGNTLIYLVAAEEPKQNSQFTEIPAWLVIHRLNAPNEKTREIRPDIGDGNYSRLLYFILKPMYSPDGKVLVVPTYAPGQASTEIIPIDPWLYQTSSGKIVRAKVGRISHWPVDLNGGQLLNSHGHVVSLTPGRKPRKLGYRGNVCAVNPVASLACIDTGTGGGGEREIVIWNLRDDKLHAAVPVTPEQEPSSSIKAQWTSDGVYLYLQDPSMPDQQRRSTLVWNAKSKLLVGDPIEISRPFNPGPRPGTMVILFALASQPRFALHDAQTGATADIPMPFKEIQDICGNKIVYVKSIDDKPHLCVATIEWNPAK